MTLALFTMSTLSQELYLERQNWVKKYTNTAPLFIYKSRDGSIWLNYFHTFVRKKGVVVSNYDLSPFALRANSNPNSQIVDYQNSVIASFDKNLLILDKKTNHFTPHPAWDNTGDRIKAIYVDTNEQLWVLTLDDVYRLDISQNSFVKLDLRALKVKLKAPINKGSLKLGNIFATQVNNNLWISTFFGGLYSLDIQSYETKDSYFIGSENVPPFNRTKIFSILHHLNKSSSKLVLATSDGLYYLDLLTKSIKASVQNTPVHWLGHDLENNVLFNSNGKPFKLDQSLNAINSLDLLDHNQKALEGYITVTLMDEESNAWIGIENHGLFRYSMYENKLIPYLSNSNTKLVGITSHLEHNNRIFHSGDFGVVSPQAGLISETKTSVIAIKDEHSLLLGQMEKIIQFELHSKQNKIIYQQKGAVFNNIIVDGKKRLWLLDDITGLTLIEGENNKPLAQYNLQAKEIVNIFDIYLSPNNNILAVLPNKLLEINIDSTPNNFKNVLVEFDDAIANAQKIGNELFLFHIDNKVTIVSLDNYVQHSIKLPVSGIRCINKINDSEWFLAQEYGAIFRWNQNTSNLLIFNENDGLPEGGVNGVLCLKQSSNYLFSTNAGLIAAKDTVLKNDIQPLASIIHSDTHQPQNITFKYDEFPQSFIITNSSYASPNKNYLKYRLVGLSDQWTTENLPSKEINYQSLSYGNYTLQVMVSNNDGIWSEPVSVDITVTPPIWLTKWAFFIYVLILLAFLWFIIWYRTRSAVLRTAQLESEIVVRTHEIEQKNRTIEALLVRKNDLFANVSHELRTPLTLILGPINALLKTLRSQEQKRQAHMIERNARRLLGLVEQLLSLARITRHEPEQQFAHPISPKLTFIIESFRSKAEEKRISLSLQLVQELSALSSDDAIEIVVGNLISNAIKYTPIGGAVSVCVDVVANKIRIQIQDTGDGIASTDQENIFERFTRLPQHQHTQGSGVGLAVVKELTEANKGKIEVKSELGKGTNFIVHWPLASDEDAKSTESTCYENKNELLYNLVSSNEDYNSNISMKESLLESENYSLETILIVDDNPEMLDFIVDTLRNKYHCITAPNGHEGIALALKRVPDLIISDVMMPVVDGFQLCRVLRSDEKTSHIPVILLTAKSDRESKIQGWRENVDDYLTKPFDSEQLRLRVKNILTIRNILKRKLCSEISDSSKITRTTLPLQDQIFIDKLNKIIESKFVDHTFGRGELASELAVSDRQLQRKLKALIDYNPADYLREYRLQKAAEKLRDGFQVAIVSDHCGFASPPHFSRCFKAKYGMTPKQYQSTS